MPYDRLHFQIYYFTYALRCDLFLSNKDIDGCATEVPTLANLVFQEALIGLLDVLWQVGVEYESWNLRICGLRTIFDLDVLTLD